MKMPSFSSKSAIRKATPLTSSMTYVQDCRVRPIERIGTFRRTLRVARLPRPLRRLLWWIGLNYSGYKRARNWGTFGVSVYSSLGAESLHPLSPLTTALNYGVIAPDGSVDVRITYDHRVMDGSSVARALMELEKILNGPVAHGLITSRNGSQNGVVQDATHHTSEC